jgi:hypothetical protein
MSGDDRDRGCDEPARFVPGVPFVGIHLARMRERGTV